MLSVFKDGLRENFQAQVEKEMASFVKKNKINETPSRMASCLAQALNFFIISPKDCEITAREMICRQIFGKKGDEFAFAFMHSDEFRPAKLIVGVTYLFRCISNLHFNERMHVETAEFPSMIHEVFVNTHLQVWSHYPDIEKQWQCFSEYFLKEYLSPWDIRRYSDYMTRANFGTGVDYITPCSQLNPTPLESAE